MLIGLVRDSVMQCFCHSCHAPVMLTAANSQLYTKKPTKIRTKQPKSSKKVKFITTEIRCQEKSKGGLSYEVILAEPNASAQQPKLQKTFDKQVSVEDIEVKLKAAEDRRLSLEAKKIADWTTKLAKIEEASRKKDEMNNTFITHTKEALLAKMDQYEEKRESMINDIKEKVKQHAQEIEKARNSVENQKIEERKALEEKLKAAAVSREENINKMLDRLKEHNAKLTEIRASIDTRDTKKSTEQTRIIENKLSTAEMNREKELQKKLDKIQEHERRAELVRQNKASLANQTDQGSVTASSG